MESNEAEARTRGALGLAVPGPVHDQLMVQIKAEWPWRSCTQVGLSIDQIFRVMSSEQEARNLPWGSHLMALTSLVWPWKDLMGLSRPSWHTWMALSVEQEAKLSSDFQSTSRAGALWKANCCLDLPVAASQIIVVLSTPALRMKFPVLFHFSAKMGPLCCPRVFSNFPVVLHILAYPS